MTDLERARQLLADDPDEMDEAWMESVIAAARREGAEEMRERAARVCERADRSTHPATCADMIRALPLTPEEPT